MTNLFILNEIFTNGLSYNMLNIISVLSLICGILVIISKNPIVSVLYLIGLFLGVASYLMMLGINFIGLSYLLVYVGAVSILFLFILMLINVRISELVTDNNNSIPLAIMIGIIFNGIVYRLLPLNNSFSYVIQKTDIDRIYSIFYFLNNTEKAKVNNNFYMHNLEVSVTPDNKYVWTYDNDLSFVSSHIWDGAIAENSHIASIGNVLYTVYPIWLILTSIILLLAMVGAIIITIKQ